MTDLAVARIRTLVPAVIGGLIAYLADTFGIILGEGSSMELIIGVTSGAVWLYYVAIRQLAEKWPGVGILLGVNKAPTYTPSA